MTTTEAGAGGVGRHHISGRIAGAGVLGRLSAGHVAMVAAALLAGVLNYGALRAADTRVAVSTAAEDLPAGHVLRVEDLGTAMVAMDDRVLSTLLRPAQASAAAGSVTTAALRAGDLVRTGDLMHPPGDGLRAMSLEVDPASAAGGTLRAGDRVDVVTVEGGRARYALSGVEVLRAERSGGPGLGGAGGLVLTVAVDERSALRLAAAIAAGELQVVRATGAPRAGGAEDARQEPPA